MAISHKIDTTLFEKMLSKYFRSAMDETAIVKFAKEMNDEFFRILPENTYIIHNITCGKILISDNFPNEKSDAIFENVVIDYKRLGLYPTEIFCMIFEIDENLQGKWRIPCAGKTYS